jgi:hypothetical protein
MPPPICPRALASICGLFPMGGCCPWLRGGRDPPRGGWPTPGRSCASPGTEYRGCMFVIGADPMTG